MKISREQTIGFLGEKVLGEGLLFLLAGKTKHVNASIIGRSEFITNRYRSPVYLYRANDL